MNRTAQDRPRGILDRIAYRVLPPLETLGEPGTILTPLVLVLVSSLLTAAAMQAVGGGVPGGSALPPASVRPWLWVLTALTPLFALLRGGLLALVGWAVLVLLGAAPRMRAVLSALLYGEAILALHGPALVLTLLVQGGVRQGPVPVATGLDLFVDPSHPVLLAVARGITPFHLAWLAFLALALASCARVSRSRGLAAGTALWLLVVGLGVLQALLAGGAV